MNQDLAEAPKGDADSNQDNKYDQEISKTDNDTNDAASDATTINDESTAESEN